MPQKLTKQIIVAPKEGLGHKLARRDALRGGDRLIIGLLFIEVIMPTQMDARSSDALRLGPAKSLPSGPGFPKPPAGQERLSWQRTRRPKQLSIIRQNQTPP
jgi:hypothetical protein